MKISVPRPKNIFKFPKQIIILLSLVLFITSIHARDWTIMVYMCADNGLDDSLDLAEMMAVGSNSQVQIIVQTDNLPSHPYPSTRRYKVEKNKLTLIEDLGEKNMADLVVATDFVKFCRSSYPAKNYCLVLWDHGCGWYPAPSPVQRAIIYDYTNHDSISVANGELRELLSEVRKVLGKKLNLLVFDACIMGQIEVASEVCADAEIFVASEALVPLDGFPYEESFKPVMNRPSMTPAEFAQALVDAYADSYNDGSQGSIPVTISAIDLTRLESFNQELNEFFEYLKNYATDSIFVSGRNIVQTFAEDNIRPPRPTDDYVDLNDFLLNTQSIAPGRYNTIFQIFDSLILANRIVGTYYPEAKGLAAWFPDNYLRFKERVSTYQNLVFANQTGWHEFLNQFYHSDDIKPPMDSLRISKVGSRNNYTIYWNTVYDLAGVTYQLTEIAQCDTVFSDKANNLDNWDTTYFCLSSNHVFSPSLAFFSGNANNLNSRLELKEPLSLPNGGLLSFYAYYNTEENIRDGKFKRDICYIEITDDSIWQRIDSLYGKFNSWNEFRYLLDSSYRNCRIRFFYKTDSSELVYDGGVYIENIMITRFGHKRTIISDYPDTSFNIFIVPKNTYYYLVLPIDGFNNKGMVSHLNQSSQVLIKRYAEPYCQPNPFFTETGCDIYLDYPADEEPKVYIYTLSGVLVKKFEFEEIDNNQIFWDGKNWKGKEVGSGIYLVAVKSKNFSRLGKIAKVK